MAPAAAGGSKGAAPAKDAEGGKPVVDVELEAVYRKISLIVVPTIMAVILFNQLDRNNIAYAALTLNRDLGFTAAQYGLGSALFFVTMVLCQVPSSMLMLRVGVPLWLGFITAGWGVVATLSALMRDTATFYALRLLLGLFEAGALPTMFFCLSQFYPEHRLTKPFAGLTIGALIAAVVGAPLAAAFLSMEGIGGLRGWQWLLVSEGVPSILLGVCIALFFPDTPAHARWLTARQKELLAADMVRSQAHSPPRHLISRSPAALLRPVLSNALLPLTVFVGFALAVASYVFLFFSPIIVAALLGGRAGLTNVRTAAKAGSLELVPVLLVTVPCVGAAAASVAVAFSSQKRGEVYLHTFVPLLLGGVLFLVFPPLGGASVAAGFVTLILVAGTTAAANAPLLAVVTRVCRGPSQAVGVAVYNSLALVGGFVGPYVTGTLLQKPSGLTSVFIFVGVMQLAAAAAMLLLRHLMLRREARQAGLLGAGDEEGAPAAAVAAAGGGVPAAGVSGSSSSAMVGTEEHAADTAAADTAPPQPNGRAAKRGHAA